MLDARDVDARDVDGRDLRGDVTDIPTGVIARDDARGGFENGRDVFVDLDGRQLTGGLEGGREDLAIGGDEPNGVHDHTAVNDPGVAGETGDERRDLLAGSGLEVDDLAITIHADAIVGSDDRADDAFDNAHRDVAHGNLDIDQAPAEACAFANFGDLGDGGIDLAIGDGCDREVTVRKARELEVRDGLPIDGAEANDLRVIHRNVREEVGVTLHIGAREEPVLGVVGFVQQEATPINGVHDLAGQLGGQVAHGRKPHDRGFELGVPGEAHPRDADLILGEVDDLHIVLGDQDNPRIIGLRIEDDDLTELSEDRLWNEVQGCKKALEAGGAGGGKDGGGGGCRIRHDSILSCEASGKRGEPNSRNNSA